MKIDPYLSQTPEINPNSLFQALKLPCKRLSGLSALKTRYRPYICPLDLVLSRIPQSTRLYDIGCGTGALLYLALKFRSARVAHGYDVSPEVVKASGVFAGDGGEFRVDYLPPERTPPDLSGYDTVTAIDVLHHIPRDRQDDFVREIVANMDSGAILIIKDIEASKTFGAWMNQLHDLLLAREWVHHRRSQDIVRLLQSRGAIVSQPIIHWTLWYPHFLVVAQIP